MHPVILKFGYFTIYSYGLMVAIGFALATLLIYSRANAFGLAKDKVIDLVIIILAAGILGARLLYVILNIKFFFQNPAEIFKISHGGLVWYGGFAAAIIALIVYIAVNKLNFWTVTDLVAPYVALAQSFGRIGCFLNGCCYGIEVTQGWPLAVKFPGDAALRCPAQLYSAAALFVIFIILSAWQSRRHFSGEIFLGYCLLYSFKRFMMEFLRGDNPKILLGLTISQVVSAIVFLAALAVFIHKTMQWKKKTLHSR